MREHCGNIWLVVALRARSTHLMAEISPRRRKKPDVTHDSLTHHMASTWRMVLLHDRRQQGRGALMQWKCMVVQAHFAVDGGTSCGAMVYRFDACVVRRLRSTSPHIAYCSCAPVACYECQRLFYVGVQTETQSPTHAPRARESGGGLRHWKSRRASGSSVVSMNHEA